MRQHRSDMVPSGILVVFQPEPEAGPDECERAGRQLRAELDDLDIEWSSSVEGRSTPAGAKGVDGGGLTTLVVTAATPGVVSAVIDAVRDWIGRRTGGGRITVTIEEDTLVLDRASGDERRELVDAFVRRHGSAT